MSGCPLRVSSSVYVFLRTIHDAGLPTNIQSMSARLIMNLCEAFNAIETRQNDPVSG